MAVAKTLAQQGVSYAGGCYGSTACEKGSRYYRCLSARLGRGLATNGCEGNLGKKIQFLHINYLELKAVFLTLTHFSNQLIHKHVLIRSDNVSVVFNINHQGGTRSLKLLQAAYELWVWADTHLSSLRAIHIPGHMNMLADALSRSAPRAGEWQLHPEIVQLIWNLYGAADGDLFARIQSAQCPRWFSLSKEVGSLGLDVMTHSWPSGLLYAFPPFPMIRLVLSRIRVTSQPLLLIAPAGQTSRGFGSFTIF